MGSNLDGSGPNALSGALHRAPVERSATVLVTTEIHDPLVAFAADPSSVNVSQVEQQIPVERRLRSSEPTTRSRWSMASITAHMVNATTAQNSSYAAFFRSDGPAASSVRTRERRAARPNLSALKVGSDTT
jgi:hypothetical protein